LVEIKLETQIFEFKVLITSMGWKCSIQQADEIEVETSLCDHPAACFQEALRYQSLVLAAF